MEEGIVIRGHDIARVVGLMAGVDVDWERTALRCHDVRLDQLAVLLSARRSRSRCR